MEGCETVLIDGDALLGGGYFAGGCGAGGLELLEGGKLALGVGEVKLGTREVGGKRLLFLERSTLAGGFKSGFSGS